VGDPDDQSHTPGGLPAQGDGAETTGAETTGAEAGVQDAAAHHPTEPYGFAPESSGTQPYYGEQPAYAEQPAYSEQPYQGQPPYYAEQPAYSEQPYQGQPPYYAEQPAYAEQPYSGAQDSSGFPAASSSRSSGVWKGVVAGVAAGIVAGLLAGAGTAAVVGRSGGISSGISQHVPTRPDQLSPRADNSIAEIAKSVIPATATVIVRGGGQGTGEESGSGSGSGFVIRSDGFLVTNNHVVSGAVNGGSVEVQFQNEDPIPAKIVGRSVSYDIAVIKVDKSGLPEVQMGDSSQVVVGDAAIAIGSPLGLDGTVTSGIISALNRPVTAGGQGEASYISALQTDAPINPGNSGGPLVNAEAQVIGVNSAIATLGSSLGGQSGSIGLGFAIPVNTAKRIADEIIATGQSNFPVIGVTVDMRYSGNGAKITAVEPGTPAASAGLKAGDVIVAVDGKRTPSAEDLLSTIRAYAPGSTVVLTVEDSSGKRREVKLTLGSKVG